MTTESASRGAARPSILVQIATPRDFPAQTPNACLTAGLDEQPQRTLDNGALGAFAAGTHRFTHQIIIDVDVRTHPTPPCVRIIDSCVSVKARDVERS